MLKIDNVEILKFHFEEFRDGWIYICIKNDLGFIMSKHTIPKYLMKLGGKLSTGGHKYEYKI